MQISKVQIKNYRSLKDVSIDFDDYIALVGANGSGKSSVLYALDWFFNGGGISASDVCGYIDGQTSPEECFVEVSVTFTGLTDADRKRLKEYGRGESATFRRTWRAGEKEKIVGNAMQGPGFAEVRGMTKVTELRPAYAKLRESLDELADLGSSPTKVQITEELARWESDPGNSNQLEAVADDDANHMFGINGANVMRECVRLVLVPAATNISSDVGSAGKGSTLNELIGALMAEAGARAQAEWFVENEVAIEELKQKITSSVEGSTRTQAERVNERLNALIPNAKIDLTPRVPDWTPKSEAVVSTDVTIDGVTNDIGRQGHGVQRAVMISMFQALVPDDALTRKNHEPLEGEDEAATAERLLKELANLPVLVVCIEEPEIYQHPIRARAFARTLTELSKQANVQVIVATHSPYFVRPDYFESLRRFTMSAGISAVASTSAVAIATATGIASSKISKVVEKRVPTEFSEGFFADAVALVEGETDRAVLEAICARLGLDLDARGLSVLEVSSKEAIRIPREILTALGIPVFVVADGDFEGAARKHSTDAVKEAGAHASHKKSTEDIVAWLPSATARAGATPHVFGAQTTVSDKYIFWHDDLEGELAAWPSFVTELTANGGDVVSRSKKDLYAYRNAVLDADLADLPQLLKDAATALAEFK
ncbi:ATP-dependent endonuclease [Rathayibacter sp. AY1B8]|uniref:ATP-dependent nuclease n=1 Tax=Rathayibacter sp. AY1B8 TaxID=2080533 RepID=UPI0015E3B6C4|nr:ATP-dependent endonuclease [Rathayibacter sp. AY1B8]